MTPEEKRALSEFIGGLTLDNIAGELFSRKFSNKPGSQQEYDEINEKAKLIQSGLLKIKNFLDVQGFRL